ncbi:MAG: hypothetical protein WD081_03835 [Gammaproteobacteria bacterium]
MKGFAVISVIVLFLCGCATVGMLPDTAESIDFTAPEGKTGWSQYHQIEMFKGYSESEVFNAAKVALGQVGFSLRSADFGKGRVVGEHGMTAHDWNVIAGVYFKGAPDGTEVAVIIEGSKDIGFSGDVTSDGWSGKILGEIRDYLHSIRAQGGVSENQ